MSRVHGVRTQIARLPVPFQRVIETYAENIRKDMRESPEIEQLVTLAITLVYAEVADKIEPQGNG